MSEGIKIESKREYTVSRDDLDTLVDMAGYGIGYWASSASVEADGFRVYEREETDKEIFEDEEHNSHLVSFEKLAEALVKIGTGEFATGYVGDYARFYLKDLDNGDAEDAAGYIDSDLADAVVQFAIFGELVYG